MSLVGAGALFTVAVVIKFINIIKATKTAADTARSAENALRDGGAPEVDATRIEMSLQR
jgi:hypothetical protein